MDTLTRRELLRGALYTGAGLTVASLVPAEAEAQFRQPSVEQQKQVGQQAAQQILQKYKEVRDSRATTFRNMGQKLVAALPQDDQRKWDFTFRVLDSDEVNAFALPGGPMFMYTGLYKRLLTEDALAAVTGHEMTHVRKEHWAKANKKQQERQIGLLAGVLILGRGHMTQAGQTIAGLADTVFSTRFSRGEEDEADKGGLQNLVDAGYNPEGMVDLFQVLEKLGGGGGGKLAGFLSDHPLTQDRIKNARQRIAQYDNRRSFPPQRPLNYAALTR